MNYLFFIALLNGAFIGLNRSLNGQLGAQTGALKASFWNHLVGFIFLTLIIFPIDGWVVINEKSIPLFAYLGGVFGAFFVALSSYLFPRIGAMNTIILVTCGQLLTAVFIDIQLSGNYPSFMQVIGIIFIIFAVYLSKAPQLSFNWFNFKKVQ